MCWRQEIARLTSWNPDDPSQTDSSTYTIDADKMKAIIVQLSKGRGTLIDPENCLGNMLLWAYGRVSTCTVNGLKRNRLKHYRHSNGTSGMSYELAFALPTLAWVEECRSVSRDIWTTRKELGL